VGKFFLGWPVSATLTDDDDDDACVGAYVVVTQGWLMREAARPNPGNPAG
jgi:hypothetical protein